MKEIGMELEVIDSAIQFKEISAPATPFANKLKVYVKDKSGTSALYLKDDAGSEREIGPASAVTGTGTANRLAYWTSASVIAAVGAITATHVLFADSNGLPVGDSGLIWNNTDKYINTPLKLGVATGQPYTISFRPGDLRLMTTQSQSSAAPFQQEWYTKDGDGTDNIGLNVFAVGLPSSLTNFEAFQFYYDAASPKWNLGSTNNGSGTVRPIHIFTGANTSQLVLNTDGTVNFGSVVDVATGFQIANAAASGNILRGDGTNFVSSAQSGLDHGSIGGLTDDDHTQYPLLVGRAGGQTLIGGTAASNALALTSTSNATRGDITTDCADITLVAGSRARMASQNRFRHLNSGCKAYRTTNQTIATSTFTAMSFDSESFDTDGLHEAVTNPTRLTIALTGKYLIITTTYWDGSATGLRFLVIRKNGVATDLETAGQAGNATGFPQQASGLLSLVAGDYIEGYVWQNTGGNLNITASGESINLQAIYQGE